MGFCKSIAACRWPKQTAICNQRNVSVRQVDERVCTVSCQHATCLKTGRKIDGQVISSSLAFARACRSFGQLGVGQTRFDHLPYRIYLGLRCVFAPNCCCHPKLQDKLKTHFWIFTFRGQVHIRHSANTTGWSRLIIRKTKALACMNETTLTALQSFCVAADLNAPDVVVFGQIKDANLRVSMNDEW